LVLSYVGAWPEGAPRGGRDNAAKLDLALSKESHFADDGSQNAASLEWLSVSAFVLVRFLQPMLIGRN
jgi:hypothetical protein